MSNALTSDMSEFGMIWPRCIARAWEDSQFRDALKNDPVGTLLKAFQFKVPAGIDFQVVDSEQAEQSPRANTLRMVIPAKPVMDMGEVAVFAEPGGPRPPPGPHPFTLSFSLC